MDSSLSPMVLLPCGFAKEYLRTDPLYRLHILYPQVEESHFWKATEEEELRPLWGGRSE